MSAIPGVGDLLRADELGGEHHGWVVQYLPLQGPEGASSAPMHRELVLIGVRRWDHEGRARVGLLAESDGPWRGREYHVPAETVVRLMRPIKKGVPRARATDYRIEPFGPEGGAS